MISRMQSYLQSLLPEELKIFMGKATDVPHWNQLREIAKSEYSFKTICLLDVSGYISEIIPVKI